MLLNKGTATLSKKIIFGPPGTGKTTKLLSIVEKELARGVPPDRMAYLAFTRKAAQEAIERAGSKFNLSKKELIWFRTIHSFVFKNLNYNSDEVMTPQHYRELAEIIKVPLLNVTSADEVGVSVHNNEHLRVYDLSRARGTTLEDEYNRFGRIDGGFFKTKYVIESLIKYKETMHVKDYTDMLMDFVQIGTTPKLEVLIVDEAQDLSWLQWNVVNKIMDHASRVYVAGDDDQAIFDWAGADSGRLVDLDWETEVLNQSYRVPQSNHKVADRLVQRIKHRKQKLWRPRKYRGFTQSYAYKLNASSFDHGEWLILARANYLLDNIEHDLKQFGHHFIRGNQPSVSSKLLKAIETWEKLRTNQEVDFSDVKDLYYYMSVGNRVKRGHKSLNIQVLPGQTFSLKELQQDHGLLAHGNFPWEHALDKVSENKSLYVKTMLQKDKSILTTPPRIKLSTIHGAKGGEADHVMLLTDLSKKTEDKLLSNIDSERRVFYVGATRAKKSLHIIRAEGNREFTEIFQ